MKKSKRTFDPSIGKSTQFRKGASPNPGGGPSTKWLTTVFLEVLKEKLQDPAARREFKESLWAKLLSNKVVSAMTMSQILDRTEGKVVQPVDVAGQVDVKNLLETARAKLDEQPDQPEVAPSEVIQ